MHLVNFRACKCHIHNPAMTMLPSHQKQHWLKNKTHLLTTHTWMSLAYMLLFCSVISSLSCSSVAPAVSFPLCHLSCISLCFVTHSCLNYVIIPCWFQGVWRNSALPLFLRLPAPSASVTRCWMLYCSTPRQSFDWRQREEPPRRTQTLPPAAITFVKNLSPGFFLHHVA